MQVKSEIIYHYVCDECSLWWSIAVMKKHEPVTLCCPHCGVQNKLEYQLDNEEL